MVKLLKVVLYVVSFYHVFIGLMGIMFKQQAVFIADTFFNFNLTLTPQVFWIINPFAAYVLVFGIFAFIAARNPLKYKNVVYVIITLFFVRLVQRLVFLFFAPTELLSTINLTQNLIHLVVVFIMGMIMLIAIGNTNGSN